MSRESTRYASRGHPYHACTAQTLAAARVCQPQRQQKLLLKLLTPWLWQYLRTHLAQGCVPEQIAGRPRRAYPDDMGKQLLAKTLYMGLYVRPAARTAGGAASGAQGPGLGRGGRMRRVPERVSPRNSALRQHRCAKP